MAIPRLRTALLTHDLKVSKEIAKANLDPNGLISTLYELIFFSISVQFDNDLIHHPVCLVNSIKNFIGDDKDNPSESLINFAIDYITEFELRRNDIIDLESFTDNKEISTAFIGDLEDAYQSGNWGQLEKLMKKVFIASDRSRAIFDTLSELALQDSPRNAIFIYHILRAYQFQGQKEDNWAFIQCIFTQLCMEKPKDVHRTCNIDIDSIRKKIIENGDIVYFSAIDRILSGDYVRSRGYQRELSYWLSQIAYVNTSENQIYKDDSLIMTNKRSFINYAKKIINSDSESSKKARDIVSLDALRYIRRKVDRDDLLILGSRYNKLLQ